MTTLTTDTALETVQNTFNFSVDKFPLYGPDNMQTPHFGLFRSDNSECVGKTVSGRYVPHNTDDILAITEAAAEAFDGDTNVRCHFRNGHFVQFAPSNQDRRDMFNVAGGDNIFPRFMVNGGYDGRGFRAEIGFFRDMCLNLSMMKSVESFSRSIRHTSGLRSQMTDLIGAFSMLKESWCDLTAMIKQMSQQTDDMRDFLCEIYPEPAEDAGKRAVTVHKNRTELILKRLSGEMRRSNVDFDLRNPNAWLAYNAVQGYEQHDATRRKSFNNDFDRVLKAGNSQAVHKAEKLALALIA